MTSRGGALGDQAGGWKSGRELQRRCGVNTPEWQQLARRSIALDSRELGILQLVWPHTFTHR